MAPGGYRTPIISGLHPDPSVCRVVTLDGRYLSTETAGGFTGRVVGMFAVDGPAHFDRFDCTGGEAQEGSP